MITPDFIGTLPGWITAASTTTGVAAVIIAFFRRGVSLKGLQNADDADIRDHYADEVKRYVGQIEALTKRLDAQDLRYFEYQKLAEERWEECQASHRQCEEELSGLKRQIARYSADKLVVLENPPAAPESKKAAHRVRKIVAPNGEKR